MRSLSFAATLASSAGRKFLRDDCSQMAAAISYYVLFSLFPLLIFLVGIMGLVLRDESIQQDVIDGVLDMVPLSETEGRNDVTEAVRGVAGVGSGALGVFGLIGMAWAGSSMFGVMRRSLDRAFGAERRRPFVQQKLLDLAMVLGVSVFFLALPSPQTR